jgi:predicted exporter
VIRGRWALVAWAAGLVVCALVVARTHFTEDLSAFLPRNPSPEQRILAEQLRDGVVSRLVLLGIEGATPERLAADSKRLAAALRAREEFVSVNNGEDAGFERDREFLWRHRYLLSRSVTPERFSTEALRASLEEDLRLLGSPLGPLVRRILPGDPTGELLRLLEGLEGQAKPAMRDGVWFSADGQRALLVAQTRASGSDLDGQEQAQTIIRSAFSAPEASEARLLMTGPAVFSVSTRERIRSDAMRLSVIATLVMGAMMFWLYRSPRVLGLSLLPIASGALAGVAAVSLGFGSVHGLTLAFGVTLIGEGVDYAIYLFSQVEAGAPPQQGFNRIWPTLRLGMLTSICGFSAMLFSGFTGLAQLGLFSIAGLLAAVAVTRWVLPALLPAGFTVSAVAAFGPRVMSWVHSAGALRYPALFAIVAAIAVLAFHQGAIWSDDVASLSPVPAAEQRLDQELRQNLGAPDVGQVVVLQANDEEGALQASEAMAVLLQDAVRQGWLEGYDMPSAYLPSRTAQRARQAAIPEGHVLRANLRLALHGLPFRTEVFEPFLKDVAAASNMPLITRESLKGTNLALKVDSLLLRRDNASVAMLPLRNVVNSEALAREIEKLPRATLLNVKAESSRLYSGYLREAKVYSLLGALAIAVLLALTLRSARRVFEVLAPLAAAVLITAAVLVLSGEALTIFHLVGLLLVVAVGSNYSLFFERQAEAGNRERTIVSLLFAAVSTVVGFGLLAFSKVPVLHALGVTVGLGAVLALVFSAVLGAGREASAVPGGR